MWQQAASCWIGNSSKVEIYVCEWFLETRRFSTVRCIKLKATSCFRKIKTHTISGLLLSTKRSDNFSPQECLKKSIQNYPSPTIMVQVENGEIFEKVTYYIDLLEGDIPFLTKPWLWGGRLFNHWFLVFFGKTPQFMAGLPPPQPTLPQK